MRIFEKPFLTLNLTAVIHLAQFNFTISGFYNAKFQSFFFYAGGQSTEEQWSLLALKCRKENTLYKCSVFCDTKKVSYKTKQMQSPVSITYNSIQRKSSGLLFSG